MKRHGMLIGRLVAAMVLLVSPPAGADVVLSTTARTGGGGGSLVAGADDTVFVSNGTVLESKAIPDCDDAGGNHLNYDTTTNAFSCGTSGSGLSSPIAGDYVATGEWTWGTADDAANNVSLGETAGGVVFEGATADAFEATLGSADVGVDVTYNLPATEASGAGTYNVLTTAPHPRYHCMEDDFTTGATASGSIGLLAWTLGAGTVTGVAVSEAAHPGIHTLSSSAASGTIGRIVLNTGAAQSYMASQIDYFACLVNPRSGTATMSSRCGLVVSVASSAETSQGIYWSFEPGTSANWRTVTRNGAGITSNSTATAYATSTWYLLEIKRASNGTDWEFWLNGTLRFTHTANLITTTNVSPGFYVETNEAVAKTSDIDWAALCTGNLGQRF